MKRDQPAAAMPNVNALSFRSAFKQFCCFVLLTSGLIPAHALAAEKGAGSVPQDFPAFKVPGLEQDMAALRRLFWLHYPGASPKSTLWDEWLSMAALWPGTTNGPGFAKMRDQWRQTLSLRIIDPEGYVATHQHPSIAHQLGWPFPFHNQGQGGFGWHFSFAGTVGPPWRQNHLDKPDGWHLAGISNGGVTNQGWLMQLEQPGAAATSPKVNIDAFNAPFVQVRWIAQQGTVLHPFLEWTHAGQELFAPTNRMYFDPPAPDGKQHFVQVPVFRHPGWTNRVEKLRLNFGNETAAGTVWLHSIFSNYDTRHNVNAQAFIRGAANYFYWTGDFRFLRENMNRLRTALRHMMTAHHCLERNVVLTTWVGHDGRPGWRRNASGPKTMFYGHGIGNNYWDLLPFGNLDCYATIQYYDAVLAMARLEADAANHPEWDIPQGALAFTAAELRTHARRVKDEGNRLFWNADTGRFAACIDADDKKHDYGLTFLNCEAVAYDFATPEHARAIYDWLEGVREVAGDTAQGADIYHWRFAPRATTLRNIDWYFWAWTGPETIPWGGQVQDGGAVLGFAYHDLLGRLKVLGPDNAWNRLRDIIRWFEEVETAGGYRKYYDGSREGTLQGGGTAGGLGLDHEFFESVLVPQIMLYGFMGFSPTNDGFEVRPALPSSWPELTIAPIRIRDNTLSVRVTPTGISVRNLGPDRAKINVRVPQKFGHGEVWHIDLASGETAAAGG